MSVCHLKGKRHNLLILILFKNMIVNSNSMSKKSLIGKKKFKNFVSPGIQLHKNKNQEVKCISERETAT